jgi:hypothetical protein
MSNLHDGSEFFNNCTVGITDTKGLASVLTKCAVVHKIVVFILIADVLLAFLLAFEQPAEPIKNAVGRLQLIISLLELAIRMRNAGKGKGADEREAQGHCNEGLHGEAPRASE